MNLQLAEKPVRTSGDVLDIISVFPTIQGEGPLVGTPSVFVRLAGCTLQCPACDTGYTEGRMSVSVDELLERIRAEREDGLVVLTGGEPFRQNISQLAVALYHMGYSVQVETNGTLYLKDFPYFAVSIVCSPKTAKIHPQLISYVSAYKYILEAGKIKKDGLPSSALGMPFVPARPPRDYPREKIFVQPLDEQDEERNKLHRQTAVESCLTFGYRLSIQTHKILGLE